MWEFDWYNDWSEGEKRDTFVRDVYSFGDSGRIIYSGTVTVTVVRSKGASTCEVNVSLNIVRRFDSAIVQVGAEHYDVMATDEEILRKVEKWALSEASRCAEHTICSFH